MKKSSTGRMCADAMSKSYGRGVKHLLLQVPSAQKQKMDVLIGWLLESV